MMIAQFLLFLSTTTLFVLGLQSITSATEITLSGTVVNETMQPIANAQLYLYSNNHVTARSNDQGKFTLTGDLDTTATIRTAYPSLHRTSISSTAAPVKSISLFDGKGRKVGDLQPGSSIHDIGSIGHKNRVLAAGVYLAVVKMVDINYTVKIVVTQGKVFSTRQLVTRVIASPGSHSAASLSFSDILIASSAGTQTARRAVTTLNEHNIILQLMPTGAGNVTPGIPVFTDKGGMGDITTYGSVHDPEFSQGGGMQLRFNRNSLLRSNQCQPTSR